MRKQLIIIGIVVVLLVVGLSGCNETSEQDKDSLTDQEKIVGKWKFFTGEGSEYNFYANGSYIKSNDEIDYYENGTYELQDGKLIISTYFYENYSSETVYDYWFSHNDNRLTIREEGSDADEPYEKQ